jgi:hypothetical protein
MGDLEEESADEDLRMSNEREPGQIDRRLGVPRTRS